MQIGIDSFAAAYTDASRQVSPADRLRNLIEEIEHADQVGLDVFGIGEHHRAEYLDSAPAVILGAAAARTRQHPSHQRRDRPQLGRPGAGVPEFRDPGSRSRRGAPRWSSAAARSSSPSRCSACDLEDYDSLFAEKLDLLLKIRDNEHVHWSGQASAAADRPGRVPATAAESAADLARRRWNAELVRSRRRARPAADGRDHRRRDAALPAAGRSLPGGRQARGAPARATQGRRARARLRRGDDARQAADDFFPGYARAFTTSAKERGWPPVTRADFDAQRGPEGALLIGSPEEVAEKVARHSEALGGISRVTFQMNAASLPHDKLMQAIEAVGEAVAPALRGAREAA